MKEETGTISYLWTSISNSLNTKNDREHFFRYFDQTGGKWLAFTVHIPLQIIYVISFVCHVIYIWLGFKSRKYILESEIKTIQAFPTVCLFSSQFNVFDSSASNCLGATETCDKWCWKSGLQHVCRALCKEKHFCGHWVLAAACQVPAAHCLVLGASAGDSQEAAAWASAL